MPGSRPRYALNFAVLNSLYSVSESFLKRASAAGVDLRSDAEIKKYIREHGRHSTQKAFHEADYYHAAIAAIHGETEQRITELARAGVDVRDAASVRAHLAAKRQAAPLSPTTTPPVVPPGRPTTPP